MKKRNVNIETPTIQTSGGCCGPKPSLETTKVANNQSSCCGTANNVETVAAKPKTSGCC